VKTLSHTRVDVTVPAAVANIPLIRRVTPLFVVTMILFALIGCSESTRPSTTPAATAPALPLRQQMLESDPAKPLPASGSAQRRLASDPAHLADDLVTDQQVLRDPSSSEAVLVAAARRQHAAYRALGRHPEWDPIARPRIPPSLLEIYDRNVDARRQLTAMSKGYAQPTLPAWRIDPPPPADELLGYYREAESASGVGWTYLAAINLIETGFARIAGVSTAGAQGPMQFLPSTFAAYGEGDILSPHDSIMAAGRYLAANGFQDNRDYALYRYNNSNQYVQAVNDYAAVLAADPAALAGYHRWDVYYNTTAGDVVLPIGYSATSPIPVADYLATHPQ
jgi:soluble lytic murein transglycosylase-like protein